MKRTALYEIHFDGKLQYVGVSHNPDSRKASHLSRMLFPETAEVRVVAWYDSAKEAKKAETEHIKKTQPPLNIACLNSIRTVEAVRKASLELHSRQIEIRRDEVKAMEAEFEDEMIAYVADKSDEGMTLDEIHSMFPYLNREWFDVWKAGKRTST